MEDLILEIILTASINTQVDKIESIDQCQPFNNCSSDYLRTHLNQDRFSIHFRLCAPYKQMHKLVWLDQSCSGQKLGFILYLLSNICIWSDPSCDINCFHEHKVLATCLRHYQIELHIEKLALLIALKRNQALRSYYYHLAEIQSGTVKLMLSVVTTFHWALGSWYHQLCQNSMWQLRVGTINCATKFNLATEKLLLSINQTIYFGTGKFSFFPFLSV